MTEKSLDRETFETDYMTCCGCGETDCFEYAVNPDDAVCKHCGHTSCSECHEISTDVSYSEPIIVQGLSNIDNTSQSPTNVQGKHENETPELNNIPIITGSREDEAVEKLNPQRIGGQSNLISSYPDESSNHLDPESSDVSSCNDSILSETDYMIDRSIPFLDKDSITYDLIEVIKILFRQDEALMLDIQIAVSKENISLPGTEDIFRKLLKRFGLDLKVEARKKSHRRLGQLIISLSNDITSVFFKRYSPDRLPKIPDVGQRDLNRRNDINHILRTLDIHVKFIVSHVDSDKYSLDEDDENPYDSYQFITGSIAYETLRRRLHEFIHPDLRSKLRNLLKRWSRNDHEYHAYIAHYRLLDLAAELQYINPYEIRFETGEKSNYIRQILGHCQSTIENRTGAYWDWSPLPRFARPLKHGEARIRWKCTCGEERQAEVPLALVERLQPIIRNLPQTTQFPPTQFHGGSSGLTSTNNNQSQVKPYQKSQGHQPSAHSLPTNATRARASLQATIRNTNVLSQRILFVVKSGIEYKITQIGVNGVSCQEFFSTLKKDYFRLRGFIRTWFSIWRYSHCEFYMCEKFDDHRFAPRTKNVFPEVTNTDYEYRPRPMDLIPPVSEHEFTTRFYACHKSRSLCHWYHKCKALGHHSYDILGLFPKKMSLLEEAGDKREYFWGIYAREMISLRWVLAYNVFCTLPMLAIFILRLLTAGDASNLQDPSVPFTMMLGMLSLFWAIFLSSLQFGRSVG